jgi:hypothetical protein
MLMKSGKNRGGSALLLAVIIVIIITGIGGAIMSEVLIRGSRQNSIMRADEALSICDAALELARCALLEWRNHDPINDTNPQDYAWNQIFQYSLNVDAANPGMGTSANATVISQNALAQFKSGALKVGDPSGSTIPTSFQQLFCVQRPYGKGAYYMVFRNNQDFYGNGIDDNDDGDSWDPDTPAEVAAKLSSPVIDGDRRGELIITATLPGGMVRQIEVLVEYPARKYTPAAALLDSGTIKMSGSFDILGQKGSVQANQDMVGNGGNATVSVSVNASGSAAGFSMNNMPPGGINSGVAPASIPQIDLSTQAGIDSFLNSPGVSKFKDAGDIIMFDAQGNATNAATGASVGTASNFGFSLKSGTFSLSGKSAPPPQIYFFTGNVAMTGQGNAAPYNMSIIATGSVSMAGNAAFSAFTDPVLGQTGTLIVAGQDLDLGGTGGATGAQIMSNTGTPQYSGVTLAVEQIKIHGNFSMKGAVIGENLRDTVGSLITNSSQVTADATVIGNPTIVYDGGGTFLPGPAASVSVINVRRTQ